MNATALRAIADAADALARLARAAIDDTNDPNEHLSLEQARQLAKLRTTRPIKDAGRAGELTLFGSQRSRTVKRGDLMAWIESRRSKPVIVPVDADLKARMKRLAAKRSA